VPVSAVAVLFRGPKCLNTRFSPAIAFDCCGLLKMSESDVVYRWLGSAAQRMRVNERLEDGSRLLISLLFLAIGYTLVDAVVGVRPVVNALSPLLLLATVGVVVFFAWRMVIRDLLLPPNRAAAAAMADARGNLNNELSSAFWFISSSSSDRFVRLHLAHAALGLVLVVITVLVVWMSPRFDVTTDKAAAVRSVARPGTGSIAFQEAANEDDFEADEFAAERSAVAWLKVEKLARELRAGPETAEIAQAIAARDARSASQLLAGMSRRQAAQPASGRAARPETEQMSAQLAKGIVERLQSLLNDGGGWSGQASADSGAESTERLTDELTRELREEMDNAQPGLPGEMSPQERILNTTLQGMSRESTGGSEVVRGETNPMQGLGRTTVGSGAMGRRIGVSTAGAGSGEQPHANPEGDAEAAPVLGGKTLRLQLQMQTVTIDQPQTDSSDGSDESFYAATQAQAAKAQYQDIVAGQHSGVEQSTSDEQLPLAYRGAVKEYSVRQHRREGAAQP
jgi:hypothetical protein